MNAVAHNLSICKTAQIYLPAEKNPFQLRKYVGRKREKGC